MQQLVGGNHEKDPICISSRCFKPGHLVGPKVQPTPKRRNLHSYTGRNLWAARRNLYPYTRCNLRPEWRYLYSYPGCYLWAKRRNLYPHTRRTYGPNGDTYIHTPVPPMARMDKPGFIQIETPNTCSKGRAPQAARPLSFDVRPQKEDMAKSTRKKRNERD